MNKKRHYSAMTLEETMNLIGQENVLAWQLHAPPRLPSDILIANLERLKVFDLELGTSQDSSH
jgi:hypothetical protein